MTHTLKYYWSKIFKKLRLSAVRGSTIDKTSKVESGSHIINVTMDRHSFCGYDCEIYNTDIGSFCSIANNVIIGGAAHPISWVSTSPAFYRGRDSIKKKYSAFEREPEVRTIIGHDVWIGQYSLIKQGITVGTGAVVGMGSVVTKDVAPYTIVAGNPARVIRDRFSDELKEQLIESEWWKLDDATLEEAAKQIREPENFIKHFIK